MKFSCTQENLKKGLLVTSTVANKNINLPILNNVLIKLDSAAIQFVSTNLEVAVRCSIRGKVEEAGEFTLPSKLFLDYINLLPEDRVDLDLSDSTMKIACRKNATKIKGISASEFPLIPNVERQAVFYLNGTKFRKALSQVIFAVSGVESRPELTGVFFNINPPFAQGKLVMAATDSYRLSEKTLPFASDPEKTSTTRQLTTIVPGRTLTELSRILSLFKDGDGSVETVEVSIGESQIAFRFGDIEMISRVIDGKYPDYRPIVPEKFSTEVLAAKIDIVQAIKSASLFSRAGLQDVHLTIDPKDGLTVASGESQMGKNDSVVDAAVEGQKNSITLNYRYVLDGIGSMDGSKIRLKMIDAANPCVVAPEETDEGEKLLYIVMPIKQ